MRKWNKIEVNLDKGRDDLKRKWKTEEERILDSIKNAHSEMEQATLLFNEMTDADAVDYASYYLLAARTRYSYLIQLAKKKGLTIRT